MRFLIILALFLSTINVYSQTLRGSLKSETGENVSMASMLIKEADSTDQIKEFTTIRNAIFNFKLKKEYKRILIEIKAVGYEIHKETILNPEKDKIYDLNFKLVKNDTIKLKEIIITAKKSPIQINGDTVSYNVQSYKDGSERKIEDILKKLPGIEVNEKSGEIKYKGKSIETVKLDGDNLFGSNYSIGTKNINVDMVEQVQAIENYSENPLLKNIETGDKVVLNLKIKKGKHDISGNIDAGLGVFSNLKPSTLLNSTMLGINNKFKSFGTLAYNNIGLNNSPFNYLGGNYNIDQLKDISFFAEKIIPENQFNNFLNEDRININSQFFGNFNSIFKLSKRINLKTNIFYLKDKIESNRFIENRYQFNDSTFSTSDEVTISKKPILFRGDLELKWNTSKNSLFEYDLKVKQENINSPAKTIANNLKNFTTNLFTNDLFFKQKILFTNKISDEKVAQFSLNHSFNNLPQRYSISPFSNENGDATQFSRFTKSYVDMKITVLGIKNNLKYSINIGSTLNSNPYFSNLSNIKDGKVLESQNSLNNLIYSQKSIYSATNFQISKKVWRFSSGYSLTFLNQHLSDNVEMNSNDIVFEPFLSIRIKPSTASSLTLKINYTQKPSSEQYFFSNQVLLNNRISIKNIPDLRLQKYQNYSLTYNIIDLYNQFQLSSGLDYQKNTGIFFSNFNITPLITQVEFFYLPKDNSNISSNFNVSKFISAISSTIKLNSTFTFSQCQNTINNSELRKNQNTFLSTEFIWKTAFDIPINFENKIQLQNIQSKSFKQTSFTNNSIQYAFKVFYNISKQINFSINSDFYLPNSKSKKEYYLFLDSSLRYRPENKPWEVNLYAKNLTNTNNFEQIQTTDISTNIYRINILPRYLLISFSYRI
jgi:hypothetical protein